MMPLVLVHGFMGGSDQWALQAPLSEGRDLITVDLPGFGKNSQMPPINTIKGVAERVLAEIAHQEFDLLGHSMGGMIVQEMIRLAPDRVCKLVLYGTGATGELPAPGQRALGTPRVGLPRHGFANANSRRNTLPVPQSPNRPRWRRLSRGWTPCAVGQGLITLPILPHLRWSSGATATASTNGPRSRRCGGESPAAISRSYPHARMRFISSVLGNSMR